MRKSWAQFVKDPVKGPGWDPNVPFSNGDIGILGANGSSDVEIISRSVVYVNCTIFASLCSDGPLILENSVLSLFRKVGL